MKKGAMEGVELDKRLALSKPTSTPVNPDFFPSLLRWPVFHETVKKWKEDDDEEKFNRMPKTWLSHISRKGDLFLEFFTEWLTYINGAVQGHEIDWMGIPGYCEFVRGFFHMYSTTPPEAIPQRILGTCESLLLATDHPAVINALVRIGYARTPAHETNSVVAMLLAIESWLGDISRAGLVLGDGFDATHLAEGLDIILQSDHHLIIAKELSIIYNFAELFQGESRITLFGELLLRRHFFHLFLHWDENVRNIFCQVIAFKMLQSKRRYLSVSSARQPRRKGKKDDKSQTVDMLILVKIEAYIRIVTEFLDKEHARKAAAQTLGPLVPLPPKQAKPKKFLTEPPPPPPSTGDWKDIMPKQSAREISASAPASTSTSPTAATTIPSTSPPATAPVTPSPVPTSPDIEPDSFPMNLAVYAERAYEDYRKHMMRYNEWQTRSSSETPKLLTLS